MSVYAGIDVHRKRSQVAVVAEDGQVQLNKNVVNGSEPFLRLIGDLPAGTPVAFEAADPAAALAAAIRTKAPAAATPPSPPPPPTPPAHRLNRHNTEPTRYWVRLPPPFNAMSMSSSCDNPQARKVVIR
jgi:hypothetical protein